MLGYFEMSPLLLANPSEPHRIIFGREQERGVMVINLFNNRRGLTADHARRFGRVSQLFGVVD